MTWPYTFRRGRTKIEKENSMNLSTISDAALMDEMKSRDYIRIEFREKTQVRHIQGYECTATFANGSTARVFYLPPRQSCWITYPYGYESLVIPREQSDLPEPSHVPENLYRDWVSAPALRGRGPINSDLVISLEGFEPIYGTSEYGRDEVQVIWKGRTLALEELPKKEKGDE